MHFLLPAVSCLLLILSAESAPAPWPQSLETQTLPRDCLASLSCHAARRGRRRRCRVGPDGGGPDCETARRDAQREASPRTFCLEVRSNCGQIWGKSSLLHGLIYNKPKEAVLLNAARLVFPSSVISPSSDAAFWMPGQCAGVVCGRMASGGMVLWLGVRRPSTARLGDQGRFRPPPCSAPQPAPQ